MLSLRGMVTLTAVAAGACSGGGSAADGDATDSEPADAAPPDPCDPLGDRPGVCPARGVYAEPVAVELRAPAGTEVYYTLDGTEPDEASGTLYTAPIAVAAPADRGMVILRARAVDPATGPRPIVTHSYVFPAGVLVQAAAPAGVPATWGNGSTRPGDYQMDP